MHAAASGNASHSSISVRLGLLKRMKDQSRRNAGNGLKLSLDCIN